MLGCYKYLWSIQVGRKDRAARGRNSLNPSNSGVSNGKNLKVKLVVLGDSGVGKSCIVLRFVRGQFDPTSKVTVEASFLSQTIALQDSTMVKFEIWDTAGQERYAALSPLYYRGAGVAVIAYDITNPESFIKAQYWIKDGIDCAEKNGMFFIETSAKTADNINQLFEEIAKQLPRPETS